MSAVKEPSIHSSRTPSREEKGTILPSASLARRPVGFITVGRQHDAWTADRMSTLGVVSALRRSEPRTSLPSLDDADKLMLTMRPVLSNASRNVASP